MYLGPLALTNASNEVRDTWVSGAPARTNAELSLSHSLREGFLTPVNDDHTRKSEKVELSGSWWVSIRYINNTRGTLRWRQLPKKTWFTAPEPTSPSLTKHSSSYSKLKCNRWSSPTRLAVWLCQALGQRPSQAILSQLICSTNRTNRHWYSGTLCNLGSWPSFGQWLLRRHIYWWQAVRVVWSSHCP